MAYLFASFGAGKEKSGSVLHQGGPKKFLLIVGALCAILGTAGLRRRHGRLIEAGFDEDTARLREDPFQQPSKNWLHRVNISIVTSAVEGGAVCLDGSPPAYFLDKGTGEGVNNWVIFLEGGGWCASDQLCFERSFTELGSSRHMPRSFRFHMAGMLSSSPIDNPDFYNWNRVFVKYCDGGSFNADVNEPVQVELNHHSLQKNDTGIVFYRGQRIWKAVMEELLGIGMNKAQKAFLTGCSAGGLASILHCDQYGDLMPKGAIVKCLSDAGFFINVPDISGVQTIEAYFAKVVQLHNMAGNLPDSCTSEREVTQCMFPEYSIKELRTPLFLLSPGYDFWQFDNVFVPQGADPEGIWDDCKKDLASCSKTQLRAAQGLRDSLLKRVQTFLENEEGGAFINSCYGHCQSHMWRGNITPSPEVDSKSVGEVVGDWYFKRNVSQVIDNCPFPCNPTCPKLVIEHK